MLEENIQENVVLAHPEKIMEVNEYEDSRRLFDSLRDFGDEFPIPSEGEKVKGRLES